MGPRRRVVQQRALGVARRDARVHAAQRFIRIEHELRHAVEPRRLDPLVDGDASGKAAPPRRVLNGYRLLGEHVAVARDRELDGARREDRAHAGSLQRLDRVEDFQHAARKSPYSAHTPSPSCPDAARAMIPGGPNIVCVLPLPVWP